MLETKSTHTENAMLTALFKETLEIMNSYVSDFNRAFMRSLASGRKVYDGRVSSCICFHTDGTSGTALGEPSARHVFAAVAAERDPSLRIAATWLRGNWAKFTHPSSEALPHFRQPVHYVSV